MSDDPKQPWCCEYDCEADAEYSINPVPMANFEDVTESCAACIGKLLGTTGEQTVTHYVVTPL